MLERGPCSQELGGVILFFLLFFSFSSSFVWNVKLLCLSIHFFPILQVGNLRPLSGSKCSA